MMQHTAKSQAVSNPGSIRYHDDGTTELAGNVPPPMVVGELIHQLGVFLATLEVCERGADGGYVLRAPGTSLHRGLGETWRRVLQLVGALIGGSIDLKRRNKLSDSGIAWSNVEARRSDLPLSDLLQVLTWSILHGPSGEFVTTLPAATVDRIRGVKRALEVQTESASKDKNQHDSTVQPGDDASARYVHSDDFTWIIFAGTHYSFSKGRQAECIRVLWHAWERGGRQENCGLKNETLAVKCGSQSTSFRLKHVFRNHPAWGTLIKPVRKGVFALSTANTTSAHTS